MRQYYIPFMICALSAFMSFFMFIAWALGVWVFKDEPPISNWVVFLPLLTSALFSWLAWLEKKASPQTQVRDKFRFAPRDAYRLVILCWLIIPVLGAVPYMKMFQGNFLDAYFESVSGFTTTGATLMTEKEFCSVSKTIFLWRAMTQWLGGLGLLMFVVFFVPLMYNNGGAMFGLESTGIKSRNDRISSRFDRSARWCLIIYVGLTVAEAICLWIARMEPFDCICYSLVTISTGGFETRIQGLEKYYADTKFPLLDWVFIVFMYLGACNFLLHYRLLFKGKFQYHKSGEWRFYTGLLLVSALIIGIYLKYRFDDYNGKTVDYIREALFMSVSMGTSTGFGSEDYTEWAGVTPLVLCILMCVCGCGGSTSGGMKCERVLLSWKYIFSEIKHCLHPHYEADIRVDGLPCDDSLLKKTIGFCVLYLFLIVVFAVLIGLCEMGSKTINVNLETSLTTSLTCLSNVGIGFGAIGSGGDFSGFRWWTKIFLISEMIIGRLELYTILVVFLPDFWRRKKI